MRSYATATQIDRARRASCHCDCGLPHDVCQDRRGPPARLSGFVENTSSMDDKNNVNEPPTTINVVDEAVYIMPMSRFSIGLRTRLASRRRTISRRERRARRLRSRRSSRGCGQCVQADDARAQRSAKPDTEKRAMTGSAWRGTKATANRWAWIIRAASLETSRTGAASVSRSLSRIHRAIVEGSSSNRNDTLRIRPGSTSMETPVATLRRTPCGGVHDTNRTGRLQWVHPRTDASACKVSVIAPG
jgi:hypothetical protein